MSDLFYKGDSFGEKKRALRFDYNCGFISKAECETEIAELTSEYNLTKNSYYNTSRPFHVVSGTGEGSVTLLIRKNLPTFLFRLIAYGETNRYVTDSRGKPLVYNKIALVAAVIDRKHKVHAHYNTFHYDGEEWSHDKYNSAFDGTLYGDGSESYTDAEMIDDPYQCWAYGYKAHFVLETPMGSRKHYAYYRPIL